MANRIAITGNTYPVKDQLRALGAKWNPDQKAWMIEEDKAEEARKIVASAGPRKPQSNSYRSCFGSGRSCGNYDEE